MKNRWAAAFLMMCLSACASGPASVIGDRPTAVIFGTVGQSEWCPAGNVWVNLGTGKFALTSTAPRAVCQERDLERATVEGRLSGPRLRALQDAFQRTMRDGLDDCEGGRRPSEDYIISNGGLQVLTVTNGRSTDAAPSDLSCWTDAAQAMHSLLEDTFPSSP